MMCLYFSEQKADKLNQWEVVMDNIEEEGMKEEVESGGSSCEIFDLPTEIITHIVSYLSLQGKETRPGEVSDISC